MSSVWYLGLGQKVITAAAWKAALGPGSYSDVAWNAANGWSVPQSGLTSPQLAVLNADTDFLINQSDGPRASGITPIPSTVPQVGLSYFLQAIAALNSFAVKTVSDNGYTLKLTDNAIKADCSGGSFSLNLPDASLPGMQGKPFYIVRTDAVLTNWLTISASGGQTIGTLTSQLLVFKNQYLKVISDGANWLVVESNYHGKELFYAESTTPQNVTGTVSSDTQLNLNKLTGLSGTLIGAGRPVLIEFVGNVYNATTANNYNMAVLLINGSQIGGAFASVSSPATTGVGAMRPLVLRKRMVLTAGVSYTFEIGTLQQSGIAQYYAGSGASLPMQNYLMAVGQ